MNVNPLLRKVTNDIVEASFELSKHERRKAGKVVLSKAILVIGIIEIIVFTVPVVLTLSWKSIAMTLSLMLFTVPGWLMVLGYLNCRIYYDERGFVSKNIFGKKRRYNYSEITGIRINENDSYIYVGKKKILIDKFAVGGNDFIKYARDKYYNIYRKGIPAEPPNKKDIFNGNIKNAEEFKALFIIMYVCVALLFIFLAVVFFGNITESGANHNATFISCSVVDGDLEMISTDGEKFKIRDIPEDYDVDKIKNLCDGKTQLEITAEKCTAEDAELFYWVKSISRNSEVVLSREEVNEFDKKGKIMMLIIIPGSFLVFIKIFTVLMIVGGRNAKKHPKFAALMFKKSYIIGYEKPKSKKKKDSVK